MGRASREKGSRGELEVAAIFRAAGFECDRTPNSGGLFIPADVTGPELGGFYIESRRRERLDLPTWIRELESVAGEAVPVLAFRRSREPWWGAMPLDELARTIRARVCAPALP